MPKYGNCNWSFTLPDWKIKHAFNDRPAQLKISALARCRNMATVTGHSPCSTGKSNTPSMIDRRNLHQGLRQMPKYGNCNWSFTLLDWKIKHAFNDWPAQIYIRVLDRCPNMAIVTGHSPCPTGKSNRLSIIDLRKSTIIIFHRTS